MKNKYDIRLETILRNYDMLKESTNDSIIINNFIMELFKTRCKNKRVAIWGAGRNNTVNSHPAVIVNKYATYVQNLICIIDSCKDFQGKDFLGLPIISPEEMGNYEIDLVIIASKYSAPEILKSLKIYGPECENIDIYNELKNNGIETHNAFFEENNMYTKLFEVRERYNTEQDLQQKALILKELISYYYSIRDFYYADHFLALYIANNYEGSEQMKQLKQEIQDLITEVKYKNEGRNGDVCLYLVDSLRAMDVYRDQSIPDSEPKIFKEYLKDAVIFTNAYSTGPTTYESMMGIIGQKYSFEKNAYENNFIFDYEEFELLEAMNQAGKLINFYVSDDYKIISEHPNVNYKIQTYLTEKLWGLATDLAEGGDETFNFVYIPYELHFPLICGYHRRKPESKGFTDVGLEDMSSFIEDQFQDCINYVDYEFEYYRDFFSEDMINVFFSDHSQVIYDNEKQKPYFLYYNDLDKCTHVTLFATGKGLPSGEYNQLVSLIDFNKIVESLTLHKKVNIPDKKEIKYQYYNIHNNRVREFARKNKVEEYIDGIQCIVSEELIYTITATGKEEVFDRLDIRADIKETERGQAFIDYIKKNYDLSFPEFLSIHYT